MTQRHEVLFLPEAPLAERTPTPRVTPTSGRFLVMHLPAFRLERCGWEADQPAALLATVKNALRLVSLTPGARAHGLWPGMTATEARAIYPEVLLELLDEPAEQGDRESLIQAFSDVSDQLESLGETDLVLAVHGTAHLFGGEEGLLDEVRDRLQLFGHQARLVIADHPVAAAALARHLHSDRRVPVGGNAEALHDLPIHTLSPSPRLARALLSLGITRVHEWARLEPASVAGRFGEEGIRLHEIARGARAHPWRVGRAPSDPIVHHVTLGGPSSTIEPLLLALSGLLRHVRDTLSAREEAAVCLCLYLQLEWGVARPMRVRLGRASRDPEVLQRALKLRLSRLRLSAPVLELTLTIEEVAPATGWQVALDSRGEANEPYVELVARLRHALGDEALFIPHLADTWRPETAWSAGNPLQINTHRAPTSSPLPDPVATQHARESQLLHQRAEAVRPTILLTPPPRLRVDTEIGIPRRMESTDGWWELQRAVGPERLQGEWWRSGGGFDRDYWIVQTQQGPAWIYQEREQWFLHGWFD